jgi:hypothetical protein
MLVLLVPQGALGQVLISEIMYDLEGTDSGREWVEVSNTTSSAIDLSGWKFVEKGTNHALTAFSGGTLLPPSGYAIIADNPDKFLADWPGFRGVLFGSSFSLSNTGETLSLKNGDAVSDTVTYTSEQGAEGDGNSLQRSGGSWSARAPTPGADISSAPLPSTNSGSSYTGTSANSGTSGTSESSSQSSPSGSQTSASSAASEKSSITVSMQGATSAVVGVPATFSGEARGLKGELLATARYLWSFGDGTMQEGKSVLHTYYIPGEYAVVLEASSNEYGASAHSRILVVPASLTVRKIVSGENGFVELYNDAPVEIDLSFWQIGTLGKTFILPKNTLILGNKSALFPNRVTLLSPSEDTRLYYPSGVEASAYKAPETSPQREPQAVSAPRSEQVPERTPAAVVNTEMKVAPAPSLYTDAVTATATVAALAEAVDVQHSGGSLKWILLLIGVVALAIAAYYVAGRNSKQEFAIVDVSVKEGDRE